MMTLRKRLGAFTAIELLAIIAVLGLLSAMLLPALARTKASAQRINCSDNLKRIGVAFQIWGASHSDLYPMRVPISSGGYADYIGIRTLSPVQSSTRGIFGVFLVMSNELSTPRVLICPAENEGRLAATTFSGVIAPGSTDTPFTNDLNTSYFVGVDATSGGPQMLLSGDHNMGSDGSLVPVHPFVAAPSTYDPSFAVSLGTNFAVNAGPGWLNTMHSTRGNVVMGDASVQQLDRVHLQQALRNSTAPGGGSGPTFRVPTGCTGANVNRVQFP